MEKRDAIRIMIDRGYELVAEIGDDKLEFGKKVNELHLYCLVRYEKETCELSFPELKYSCTLTSNCYRIDHKDFDKFENVLYLYAQTCNIVDVLMDDLDLKRDIAKGVMVEFAQQKMGLDKNSKPLSPPEPIEKPKVEKKSIEERKKDFWNEILPIAKDKGYEKDMCIGFYNYWTEMNNGGKKMRFEMEKIFDVNRRLTTWLQNDKKWLSPWKTKQQELEKNQQQELITVKETASRKELFS